MQCPTGTVLGWCKVAHTRHTVEIKEENCSWLSCQSPFDSAPTTQASVYIQQIQPSFTPLSLGLVFYKNFVNHAGYGKHHSDVTIV